MLSYLLYHNNRHVIYTFLMFIKIQTIYDTIFSCYNKIKMSRQKSTVAYLHKYLVALHPPKKSQYEWKFH